MRGRGELCTGRNWTGTTGAKGMLQSEREDIIRTNAILQHLPREAHQVSMQLSFVFVDLLHLVLILVIIAAVFINGKNNEIPDHPN